MGAGDGPVPSDRCHRGSRSAQWKSLRRRRRSRACWRPAPCVAAIV